MDEREITEIKSTKRPDATQHRSVIKRNQRKTVDEKGQRNTMRRGRGRKRNHRNKVIEEA